MTRWQNLIVLIISLFSIGIVTYYILFFTPKNSLELYQSIRFADDFEEVQKLMLEGYEGNFSKEAFEFINNGKETPRRIGQFTFFEYRGNTFVIMTTPGTERLKVLKVEELPEDVRDYFRGL